MTLRRRDFLVLGAAAGATAAFGWDLAPSKGKSLRLLILGGTGYLGPSTIEAALARGHKVAMFNRGKTRPELFPGVQG